MIEEKLTRKERSLLLYIEARAVDHKSQLERRHINDLDIDTLNRWDDEGFVDWRGVASLICILSDDAFLIAASLRKQRALAALQPDETSQAIKETCGAPQ